MGEDLLFGSISLNEEPESAWIIPPNLPIATFFTSCVNWGFHISGGPGTTSLVSTKSSMDSNATVGSASVATKP